MQKVRNANFYLAASVALLTLIVYLPALRNEFVYWDDNVYIYENIHIRSLGPGFFRWAFFDLYASNWHPLTWISHALDYALWGLNPLGHHLTNIVLHAVNASLVVLLAVSLLRLADDRAREGVLQGFPKSRETLIAAGFTGLLFGIHPLHVESVAWVSERKDLLCALFFLLSTIIYAYYAGAVHRTGRAELSAGGKTEKSMHFAVFGDKRYLAALALFLLALLSKPMAVSLPVVLLILDWYPLGRIRNVKTALTAAIEKWPFICLSLFSSIVTVYAQRTGGAVSSVEQIPLFVRVLVAAKSVIAYLGKMVIPINLVPFYPYPGNVSPASPEYMSALVLALVISAACLMLAKRQKVWLSAWSCYIATLIPVIGIVQAGGQSMADRYTYLPSIGPFLIIGSGAAWLVKKLEASRQDIGRKIALSVSAGLVLFGLLSYLTVKQTAVWSNSIVLWTQEIERRTEKIALAYANRGVAFQRKGLLDKAAFDYETAITLDPSAFRPYISLSTVFEDMGRLDKAQEYIEKAIALDPSSHEAYRTRGILYEKTGRLDAAIADFSRAISLKPSYFEAYNNRGIVFGKLGQFEKAIADYDETIRINPNHFGAHTNRGIAYTLIGQYDKALLDFNAAILLNRNEASGYFNRGAFYRRAGDERLSRADFQRACELGNNQACNAANRL